jgi:regulator of replication initiation timing
LFSLRTMHYSIKSLPGLKKIGIEIKSFRVHRSNKQEKLRFYNTEFLYWIFFLKIVALLTTVSSPWTLPCIKFPAMNTRFLFLLIALAIFSCGRPSAEQSSSATDADTTSTNQALYDQVMDIHDEVMPKMEDIYTLKKKLQDQIAATPDMVVEEKQALEKRIARLDSVGNLMMDWMHKFSPVPDTVGQEAAREYLESEMEKIRKVREAMLEAIESEKGSN